MSHCISDFLGFPPLLSFGYLFYFISVYRNLFLAHLLSHIDGALQWNSIFLPIVLSLWDSCPVTAFKLIPLLVSVALPAHSHAIANPRGVKRSRTPEHRNGHAEGDQDDGTCAARRPCQYVLSKSTLYSTHILPSHSFYTSRDRC